MKTDRIPSSEFRTSYSSLSVPVTVTALGRVIGTWYPVGTVPVYVEEDPRAPAMEAEIRHLKQLLAERATSGDNVFTPAVAVRAGIRGESHPAPKGK